MLFENLSCKTLQGLYKQVSRIIGDLVWPVHYFPPPSLVLVKSPRVAEARVFFGSVLVYGCMVLRLQNWNLLSTRQGLSAKG